MTHIRRLAMMAFCPRLLIKLDTRKVFAEILANPGRGAHGYIIRRNTRIPAHQLRALLLMLERNGHIERDPGPFDYPYTPDVERTWWAPGRNWQELVATFGPRR